MENKSSKTNKLYLGIGALALVTLLFTLKDFFSAHISVSQNSLEAKENSPEMPLTDQHSNSVNQTPNINKEAMEPQLQATNKVDIKQEVAKLSLEDQKKWSDFEDIMTSKNDNDPRIDSSLTHLSKPLHDLMIKKYDEIDLENRSERGLVAFLIARDLKSPEDIHFLKKIYQEKPCLSLSNCSESDKDADPHHSSTNNITLDYPQIAALYKLEAQLIKNPNLINDPAFRALLDEAAQFDSPAVKRKAEELIAKYTKG